MRRLIGSKKKLIKFFLEVCRINWNLFYNRVIGYFDKRSMMDVCNLDLF